MTVYKYLAPERMDDVLKNGMIRFTQAAALNDPFETRPNLEEFAKYQIDEARYQYEQHGGALPSDFESRSHAIADKNIASGQQTPPRESARFAPLNDVL